MKDIEKNRAINILVPRLIDKTKNLQKEIKSRILLNKIFSEFENKASNKLNYFIKNSRKRYNCGKFGNNIDSFLSETERDNIKEANKIINNDFYKDTEMKLEKKKMKYKSTTKLFSDINDIFEKIKYPLDEKFNRNSRKQIQLILNNKDIEKPKSEIQKVIINKISPKQRNIIRFYNQKARTTDKQVINSQLEKDQKSIQNSIDDYLSKINSKIIQNRINNQSHQEILLNSDSYYKKPQIKFPKINLLNYYNQLSRPIQPKIIKHKLNKSPDLSKILLVYKSFRQKQIKENIKKENSQIPFITEVGIKIHKKDCDCSDTQDMVYTSANNELKIKQKMDNKRKVLNDLFGIDNIPRLSFYNHIIEQKKEKMKMEKLNKIKSMNNVKISARKKMNIIINNEMKKLDDFEAKLLSKSKILKK
jgi:hypothetical protein